MVSSIEELKLDEKFDVVLLAAGLINHHDQQVRAAFIGVAAAHTKPEGKFIVERQDPAWLACATATPARRAQQMSSNIESVSRIGTVVRMTIRYAESDNVWTHSFTLEALDETVLQEKLTAAGFGQASWLDDKRCWACVSLEAVD